MTKSPFSLIASFSILLSGFVATQAQASPIIDNSRPSVCKFVKDGELQEKCNAFKLTPFRLTEKNVASLLGAEFSFENSRISYFIASESSQTIESDGTIFNVHAMVLQTATQVGFEPETSDADGFCLITSDYSQVGCQTMNFSYLYAGNPVNVQNIPTTSQNTSIDAKQYVFNTNSHINTGISINPGDKIKVAVSGSVRFGFFVGSGGPEGIIISPDYNYFFDIPHGQVIARVKPFGARELDAWLPIGGGRDFVASSQGVLEFAVNDNKPGDNSGAFRIEVTVEPAN